MFFTRISVVEHWSDSNLERRKKREEFWSSAHDIARSKQTIF